MKPIIPPRPEIVPDKAIWSEIDQEWVLVALDEKNRKNGLGRYWRIDGVLVNECYYQHGIPHGSYKRFHDTSL